MPGFSGTHAWVDTLDELQKNLRQVIALLFENGDNLSHPVLHVAYAPVTTATRQASLRSILRYPFHKKGTTLPV